MIHMFVALMLAAVLAVAVLVGGPQKEQAPHPSDVPAQCQECDDGE